VSHARLPEFIGAAFLASALVQEAAMKAACGPENEAGRYLDRAILHAQVLLSDLREARASLSRRGGKVA
jgi:hypothetical protein